MKSNNRATELMNYMIDNGIKSNNLPLSTLTEAEGMKCLLRHLVITMEFRVFKDLDKKFRTNITSRSLKITSKRTKTKDPEKKIDVATEILLKRGKDYPIVDLVIDNTTNTVLKYISRSKSSASKILEDIETEAGRKKLFLLSVYALGEASIELFGDFKHSRTMELFINTRKENEAEMRRVFSRNSWDDAVEIFKEMMETKKTALISSEANDDLVDEKMIYGFVNKEEILQDLWLLADKVRENVTGQVRLSMK